MGKKTISISFNQLKTLYLRESFTAAEIARKVGCSDVTVLNKLHQFGIRVNKPGKRRFKYKKFPFSGNAAEKAYLVGFRIGDLNVYKPNKDSKILVVRCHTTLVDQVDAVKKMFFKYGHVTISLSRKHSYYINCYLDQSFNFLLNKKLIPRWIKQDVKNNLAFIAGYIDAEGSFGLNQKRGRFKLDSYDFFVLSWMKKFLSKQEISSKLRCIYRKGERRRMGFWNSNLWRLNINYAKSLKYFIKLISPYLIHNKRIRDSRIVLNNILKREQNGTI